MSVFVLFQIEEDIDLMIYGPKVTDDVVMDCLMDSMISAMEKKRQSYYNLLTQKPLGTTTSTQLSEITCASPEDLPMVLTLDGELEQIDYILANVAPLKPSIVFVKFCGACSSSQQPNDNMRSFGILKKLEQKYSQVEEGVNKSKMIEKLEWSMTKRKILAPSSRATLLRFLRHLPSILSIAYTMPTVLHGWERTGLVPYNAENMLRFWPFNDFLTAKEREAFLDKSRLLVSTAWEKGYVPESDLEKHLTEILAESEDIGYQAGFLPTLKNNSGSSSSSSSVAVEEQPTELSEGVSSSSVGKRPYRWKKPLEERPTNHQRCLILNHPRVIEMHQDKQKVRKDNKEKRLASKKRKLEDTEGQQKKKHSK